MITPSSPPTLIGSCVPSHALSHVLVLKAINQKLVCMNVGQSGSFAEWNVKRLKWRMMENEQQFINAMFVIGQTVCVSDWCLNCHTPTYNYNMFVKTRLHTLTLSHMHTGILDQGQGVLIVFEDSSVDQTYTTSLDTIASMAKVVDSLYNRAQHLQ